MHSLSRGVSPEAQFGVRLVAGGTVWAEHCRRRHSFAVAGPMARHVRMVFRLLGWPVLPEPANENGISFAGMGGLVSSSQQTKYRSQVARTGHRSIPATEIPFSPGTEHRGWNKRRRQPFHGSCVAGPWNDCRRRLFHPARRGRTLGCMYQSFQHIWDKGAELADIGMVLHPIGSVYASGTGGSLR